MEELRATAASSEAELEQSKVTRAVADQALTLVCQQGDEQVSQLQATLLAATEERDLLQQRVR